MAIRKYKPTTPGRRGSSVSDFAEITRSTPEKSLIRPLHGRGGRNATVASPPVTRVAVTSAPTVIDFRRNDKDGVPAKVAHIEYDPNRTARIALLHTQTARSATSSPQGPGAGRSDRVRRRRDIKPGNNLPLRKHPHRYHDPRCGAASGRRCQDGPLRRRQHPAAGQGRHYATLRMPSGEIRRVDVRCRATVGEVGNAEQSNINWGKAGRMRWKGVRPTSVVSS